MSTSFESSKAHRERLSFRSALEFVAQGCVFGLHLFLASIYGCEKKEEVSFLSFSYSFVLSS